MSTIIILIGALVLGLIGLVVVLWRRTHHELRHIRRELRATQQELKIQRLLIEDHDDGDHDEKPKKRHLRALAFFAPMLLWIRDHPAPAAATVGTAAAVALLASASPSEPRRLPEATPAAPVTAPPNWDHRTTPPAITPPVTTRSRLAPASDPHDTPVAEADDETRPRPPTDATPSTDPPTSTSTTTTPPGDPEHPPGGGLCVVVDLRPLLGIDICIGSVTPDHS